MPPAPFARPGVQDGPDGLFRPGKVITADDRMPEDLLGTAYKGRRHHQEEGEGHHQSRQDQKGVTRVACDLSPGHGLASYQSATGSFRV